MLVLDLLACVSHPLTKIILSLLNLFHSVPGYDQHRNSRYQIFAMTFNRIPLYLFLIKTATVFYTQFSGPINFSTRTGLYHWGLILAFLALTVHVLYYLPFYRRVTNCIYASFFAVWYVLSFFCISAASYPSIQLLGSTLRVYCKPCVIQDPCIHRIHGAASSNYWYPPIPLLSIPFHFSPGFTALVSLLCYLRCRVYYTTTAWESGQSRVCLHPSHKE